MTTTCYRTSTRPKFPLGRDRHHRQRPGHQLDPVDVQQGITRHASGDWGDISARRRASKTNARLKHGDRLMSVYGSGGKRFWIITEWDRSVTTVLMPQDY